MFIIGREIKVIITTVVNNNYPRRHAAGDSARPSGPGASEW